MENRPVQLVMAVADTHPNRWEGGHVDEKVEMVSHSGSYAASRSLYLRAVRSHWLCGAALVLCAGCASDTPVEAPVSLVATALTGTACGDPDAPTPGPNPFADVSRISVAVRATDPVSGLLETVASSSAALREGQAIKIPRVPEGEGRDVIVYADGGSQAWYGRDAQVSVKRNQDNAASMLLTRYGGLSCVPTPTGIVNTVFPAAVELGDGRVLVTGGFTEVAVDGASVRLVGASSQAYLFDTRTGASEILPGLGEGRGRAGHAAVLIPSAQKVVLFGGVTELAIEESRPFPYIHDPAKGRDDYIVFDIASKTFTAGLDKMVARRGFPRALALADGTVLVTGGGRWPFDPDSTEQIAVDIFDPEDNDGLGGLLDIPPLRTFYWRAGHSLTLLDVSEQGLSTALIWGGTTPDRSLGHPAEIFRQSGRQREGVNGTFAETAIAGEVPPFSYFHETTRLSGRRFLVTGGSRFSGGQLRAPEADEAWLLTYIDTPSPTVNTKRIPGFGAGRVFHTALSHDLAHVAVSGGLGPLDAVASSFVNFDLATLSWTSADAANTQTASRGGHAAVLTSAGSILLVGGESSLRAPFAPRRLSAEIYAPSTLPVP